ncbi:MAG TPA: class I SAM-dependent methyltransferase [Armatimonadota bacterium]|nr:class I SAM-dependent methyltransferase [Armatimonadota bacterium]
MNMEAAASALESVGCLFCGDSETDALTRVRDLKFFTPGEFCLVRCRRCRLIYLNPRPSPAGIAAYYPKEYWSESVGELPDVYLDRATRHMVNAICRRYPGGRVLDVGCGTGGLVAYFCDRGMDAMGVEPMARPAQLAREAGLNVVTGYLAEAAFPDDSFDVITLVDVLEHTHDPVAVLAEARRVLKPGGMLMAKVPNISSLQARLMGPWWFALDVPRHLYHFSPATLRSALSRAGFRSVFARALPGVSGGLIFELSTLYWLRGLLLARRGITVPPVDERPASESLDGQVYASVPRAGKRAFRWCLRHLAYAPLSIENAIGRSVAIVGTGMK